MARRKEPVIPDSILDQLLNGADTLQRVMKAFDWQLQENGHDRDLCWIRSRRD